MKTKNFYLDEIEDFIKYDDSPTEFDFMKVMTIINEFLETQKPNVFLKTLMFTTKIKYYKKYLLMRK